MDPTVRIVNGSVILPAGPWEVMPEIHRDLRQDDFYPPFHELALIPALNATGGIPQDARTLHIHYRAPVEDYDWYVAELDPTTGKAYGWHRCGTLLGQWGEFLLGELEECVLAPRLMRRPRGRVQGPLLVERDPHFVATPAGLCLPARTLD
ncbi:hypothetical protein ACPC54_18800 [Kitasatospora sp. NPDC094028]